MRKTGLFSLLLIAAMLAWYFGRMVVQDEMLAFRDAAHFYCPLFEYIGRLRAAPLWNPYENAGTSLVGNATSSLFYPPAFLFFTLPIDPVATMRLYLVAHVLLAVGTSYRLARHFGASPRAALVACLSYAFCGNILYQCGNVVFLVGAAWLPVAVLCGDRMLTGRSLRAAVGLGAVLALMTLGGDPQTAYHAGLMAALLALVLRRADRHNPPDPAPPPSPWRLLRSRPALLALAALSGFALSAVQILPASEETRRSDRRMTAVARTLYELPDHKFDSLDGILFRDVDRRSHLAHVYDFSVGPWRLAEYVWPNVSGRQFPVHRRWLSGLPAEGRVWTPTLYMGVLPLLLGMLALRLRTRSDPRLAWLSWCAVLAVTAAFGRYGLGWLLDEVRLSLGITELKPAFGDPVGGLYWLLTQVLPGYVYFRYPAKLLTIAALCLSLLAAKGWDDTIEQGRGARRLTRLLRAVALASLVLAIAALAGHGFLVQQFSTIEPNTLFGPLDTAGAWRDLFGAFLHTGVFCGLAAVALAKLPGRARPWLPPALVLGVAVDLALANGWILPTAPADQWREPSAMGAVIAARNREAHRAGHLFRVYRHRIWRPHLYETTSSERRLIDAQNWDRDTLWPKYNLYGGPAVTEAPGTLISSDYQAFLRLAKEDSPPSPQAMAAMNANYAILPPEVLPTGFVEIPMLGEVADPPADAVLWQRVEESARVWVVPHVVTRPPLDSHDPDDLRRRTEDVFQTGGVWRDLSRTAVVECSDDERAALFDLGLLSPPPAKTPVEADCLIRRYRSDHVWILATLPAPGLLVFADQFAPGWTVEVQETGGPSRHPPILRTNRFMRGVPLAAGTYQLKFRYYPRSLKRGVAISGLAWLLFCIAAPWQLRRRQPS